MKEIPGSVHHHLLRSELIHLQRQLFAFQSDFYTNTLRCNDIGTNKAHRWITDTVVLFVWLQRREKRARDFESSNYRTIALISHASKVMLKILQARLQQYVNCEFPDVQAGFRKGRGTRDQIANICCIMEKARVPEKHLFLLYWLCQSLWLCGSPETVENSERDGNTRPPDLPLEKCVCSSGSNS